MELVSGKVVPGCSNAGNPFHECTAFCLERLNSGDIHKKDKKLFGFGKKTPSRDTPPGSPALGSRSPLASYFAKKKIDSDSNFYNRLSPLQGRPKNEPANSVDSLPMSPSLAGYSGGDYLSRMTDQYRGEDDDMSPRPFVTRPKTPEHPLPTPQHRPRTPEHRSDTRPWTHQEDPISLETRPRTPHHRPSETYDTRPQTPERQPNTSNNRQRTPIHESAAVGRRPQTPETRRRTAQHRGMSPEFMARSPGPRSKTPEPQPTYFESLSKTPNQGSKTPDPTPRIPQTHHHRSLDSAALQTHKAIESRSMTPEHQARTVEARPRIPESRQKTAFYRGRSPDQRENISQTQRISFETGQRSPQAYNYHGSKAESVYIANDDESVLLYPELILSPRERPPSRLITEEHIDHLDESASTDDDNFSFVDDGEHNSVFFLPEIMPKSGNNTPVHHKSRKSPNEQEIQDKENNEPPELPDESQSFSLAEISRMKGIVKKHETMEEMHSILSESYVSVGDYKVRASVSRTLQQILDKHGDIASASKLQSLTTRSYYLDILAFVVFELQTTPLNHLMETRVLEMLAIVKDVESVKIKVGWLKPVLEEIIEAVKHNDQHKMSVVENEMWERNMSLARQEMEKQVKELREKEKTMKEWRERTTEMAGKMGNLDMRRARLDKSLAILSSKVDKFQGKSVLQGIL